MFKPRTALFLLANDPEANGGGKSGPIGQPGATGLIGIPGPSGPIDPKAALAQGMDEKLTIKQRLSVMADALRGIPPADQFIKVQAELATAQGTITTQSAEITRLTAELQTANEKLTARNTDVENLDKEKAAIAIERDALKAKDQDLDARAAAKTKEQVAALGFPAASLVPQTDQSTALATTYAEAVAHYHTLTDPKAAADYYAKTITPMLNKRK